MPVLRFASLMLAIVFALALPIAAEDAQPLLIQNVRIFDGVSPELISGHVLVEGEKIARVSTASIEAPEGARVIDGAGRVLSPGLIDLHVHLTLAMPANQMRIHPWVAGALAGDVAEFFLHHGFTTVRDAGGTHPDLARAVESGMIEETARLCAEKDIVISTQVLVFRLGADMPGLTDENRRKMQQVREGQDRLMGFVKKYGLKIGFGTDLVFGTHVRLADEFVARLDYFEPAEVMRQATSESAEIIRMSGKLNRYENFGEIREGWLADLILIDGNPLEDVSLFQDPDANLDLIAKAGRIVVDRTGD